MGGSVRGRLKSEGTYVCLWLILSVIQRKLAQHCKAIIFPFFNSDFSL